MEFKLLAMADKALKFGFTYISNLIPSHFCDGTPVTLICVQLQAYTQLSPASEPFVQVVSSTSNTLPPCCSH